MIGRRDLLHLLAGTAIATMIGPASAQTRSSESKRFDADVLRAMARDLATREYRPHLVAEHDGIPLDYDLYRAIVFRPNRALWADMDLPFRADFFHAGLFFTKSVEMNEVVNGIARPIPYDPELFDFFFGDKNPAEYLIPKAFAGLRLHSRTNLDGSFSEFAVFQGASYFRAIARNLRYGLSARGVAVDSGTTRPEEFPDFTAFWLERPAPWDDHVFLHALMEGPSLTGAFTFKISTGDATVIDVQSRLYPRTEIGQIGIAPLTSMFQYGSLDETVVDDYRPAVHDSLGLAMRTGAGESIWRPLSNPPRSKVAFLQDENPRGFGLVQRDRQFSHFLDLEARYDLRPTLWIEPIGDWGKGSVFQFEFPVADETSDNVVIYWVPERKAVSGAELAFDYRMRWSFNDAPTDLARVVGSYAGRGGFANEQASRARKFVIDFAGGPLIGRPTDREPVLDLSANGAEISSVVVHANEVTGGWRAFFDLTAPEDVPIEIRCTLRDGTTALSETWTYQYIRRRTT